MTDSARTEKFGPTAGTPRKLAISVWYPAAPLAGASKGPFLPEPQAALVAAGLQGASKELIMSLPTNSYLEAPVAKGGGQYPVLLMSHGDGNPILTYSNTAEYLASRGYVVVGISHTYNADYTIFKDGSALPTDPAARASGIQPEPSENDGFDARVAHFKKSADLDAELAKDVPFVLDQLVTLNTAEGPFKGRLDLNRVGMFGHSFGGSRSFRMLKSDSRIRAAVDVDGTVYNTEFALGVNKPFMVISSKRPTAAEYEGFRTQLQALGMSQTQIDQILAEARSEVKAFEASKPAYYVKIEKALHSNFTDQGLWIALGIPAEAISTEASPESILETSNAYLAGFFDEKLLGRSAPILHRTPVAGVELRTR